jgi:hypothetical protein
MTQAARGAAMVAKLPAVKLVTKGETGRKVSVHGL